MIEPWQVYYILSPDTLPKPKHKYVVILHVGTSSCLYALINSSVNNYITIQNLTNCEVAIEQSNHDFLDYNSWIDCTGIFSYQAKNLNTLQGHIFEGTRADVLEAVKQCSAIKNKHKKKIMATHNDYFDKNP